MCYDCTYCSKIDELLDSLSLATNEENLALLTFKAIGPWLNNKASNKFVQLSGLDAISNEQRAPLKTIADIAAKMEILRLLVNNLPLTKPLGGLPLFSNSASLSRVVWRYLNSHATTRQHLSATELELNDGLTLLESLRSEVQKHMSQSTLVPLEPVNQDVPPKKQKLSQETESTIGTKPKSGFVVSSKSPALSWTTTMDSCPSPNCSICLTGIHSKSNTKEDTESLTQAIYGSPATQSQQTGIMTKDSLSTLSLAELINLCGWTSAQSDKYELETLNKQELALRVAKEISARVPGYMAKL